MLSKEFFMSKKNQTTTKRHRWTAEEDLIIRALLPGPMDDVIETLPQCTRAECYRRAVKLGISCKQGTDIPWSKQEDEIIIHQFMESGIDGVMKELPYRERSAVKKHLKELGLIPGKKEDATSIGQRRWTAEEDALIKELCSQPYDENKFPGRKKSACAARAKKLGCGDSLHISWRRTVDLKSSKEPWTEEELSVLKEKYATSSPEEIAALLKRGKTDVITKARAMGIKKKSANSWTDEEVAYLREFYPQIGDRVSNHLNRTPNACAEKAKLLGIYVTSKKYRKPPSWTEEEDAILAGINQDNIEEIVSKIPAHSKAAVINRAKLMGYLTKKKYQTCKAWTEEELEILKANYQKEGPVETARMLPKKSPLVVYHKAVALGLEK